MAENERVIATQIAQHLSDWGHETTHCQHDGWALLEAVNYNPPDLILINLRLKGSMSGVELAYRLRARWNIPIVVVSGTSLEDLPQGWLNSDGLFFLPKPFLPFQLRELVEAAQRWSSTSH
ncbi:MAG: response regulator, partial [Bacteroidia bacterium]|nr:response regulator [Bacteroidia bacterium]